MNDHPANRDDQERDDGIIDHVVFALHPDGAGYESEPDDLARWDAWESVATQVWMAGMLDSASSLPADVRDRVERDAVEFFGAGPASTVAPGSGVKSTRADSTGSHRMREVLGWLVAAASLLLATGLWWASDREKGTALTAVDLTSRAAREQLLERADDVVLARWSPTEDPDGQEVEGDLVWSPSEQQGFMRFRGLPANNPAEQQYQLWIFDEARDERYPVDGGVFDVASGETEVIVPIRAGVPVNTATLFAVTIERPGGVVVSDRERLVAVATPPAS